MADYYDGTFDVLRSDIERYPELKKEIMDTFYSRLDYKTLLNEDSYVSDDDPVAHFCDYEARYGRFEDLEDLCMELHIPYDRYTDAYDGYDSYTAYYRPDIKEKDEIFCDGAGKQTVDINEIRNLLKNKKIDMKNAFAVGEVFLKYLDTIPIIKPLEEYEGYIYKE